MRVGFNTIGFVPGVRAFGGVQRYMVELARVLAREADKGEIDELVLYVNSLNERFFPTSSPRTTVVCLGTRSLTAVGKLYQDQWTIPRDALRRGLDVLHYPSNIGPLWSQIPTVVTIHDLGYLANTPVHGERRSTLRRAYYRLVLPRVVKRARQVICISGFTHDSLCSFFPQAKSKSVVVHHGVALPGPPPTESKQSGEPVLLAVGTLYAHKQFDMLVEALAAARARCEIARRARLVIAGRPAGGEKRVVDAIQRNGLQGSVSLRGWVRDEELRDLYSQAWVFVLPSAYEGFGMPVAEAMTAGLPVIVSDIPSLTEIAGPAAEVFPVGSVTGLTESLVAVLSSAERRRRMQRESRERARLFTWEETGRRTIEAYRRAGGKALP